MKSASEAVEALNSMLLCDREAVEAVIEHRVPCNKALADHPTAQVVLSENESYRVGALGVINGVFGCNENGIGFIFAVFDDDGKLVKFEAGKH